MEGIKDTDVSKFVNDFSDSKLSSLYKEFPSNDSDQWDESEKHIAEELTPQIERAEVEFYENTTDDSLLKYQKTLINAIEQQRFLSAFEDTDYAMLRSVENELDRRGLLVE